MGSEAWTGDGEETGPSCCRGYGPWEAEVGQGIKNVKTSTVGLLSNICTWAVHFIEAVKQNVMQY